LRAYIYIYIYIYTRGCTYERARWHREREKSLFPSRMRRHGRCRRKENEHTDRRAETRNPAAKFAVSFRRDLSIPLSLSSSLSLFVRTTTRPLSYIRTRRAGRNLPPWKTTQRYQQLAFRCAIGPRRHSETQWKAQIRHRLPVYGNEFGKLLANRAGALAFHRYPPALVVGFDPHSIHRLHLLAVTFECWKLDDWS